jgi:hypothetical protein
MATKKKPNLSRERNGELISDLLDSSILEGEERKLAPGSVDTAVLKFKISRRQVLRLWATARGRRKEEGRYSASPQKKGRVGRKRLYDRAGLPSALEAVPMEQRSTIRDVSHALQIPKSTVHRMVRVDKVIRPHTSAVKPLLTDQAKFVFDVCCIQDRA